MKVISYSLFKYVIRDRFMRICASDNNSLNFERYLKGLWINFRIARLVYPGWKIIVNVDSETYKEYLPLFSEMSKFEISFYVNGVSTISESSLWRIKPVWYDNVSCVICRDLDSILTYREAQMVQEWLKSDKISHAIADSPMHCITMLTGMIGFKKSFSNLFSDWNNMIQGFDYELKGIDQSMLCHKVYPKLCSIDSILQHYIEGHDDTGLTGFRKTWLDNDLIGIKKSYKKTNELCAFIGSYFNENAVIQFLNKYDEYSDEYVELENHFDIIRLNA